MYLTYLEYADMGGTLPESQYTDLEFEAEAMIDYVTFNRLRNDTVIPDSVKRLVKYLVGLAQKKLESITLGEGEVALSSNGAAIKSQSNDGVSISYNGMNAIDVYDSCREEADKAIRHYLYGVTNEAGKYLLYRGLYCGE